MITGKKIILRGWEADDLPALQLLRNNFQLQQQLMSIPRANSIAQIKEWLTNKTKPADSIFYVIADSKSNQCVGYIQVMAIDLLHGLGKLGICVSPDAQGNGFGGEAITLLECYLVDVFNLRKVFLEVLANNSRAQGLYSKLGYKECGRLQENFFFNGKFIDVLIMEKFIGS